jgi:hypothetical protein
VPLTRTQRATLTALQARLWDCRTEAMAVAVGLRSLPGMDAEAEVTTGAAAWLRHVFEAAAERLEGDPKTGETP